MSEAHPTGDGPSLALLFPGQGTQEIGMGMALRDASPGARAVFDRAEQATSLPLVDLCASGPLEALTRTRVAQVAVVATSLAAATLLEERLGRRLVIGATAGHSVGEVAAICWAGAITMEDAFTLVDERGRLMERDASECDGTMVAVLGLDADQLEPVCAEASRRSGETVQVANLNAPGQVVLSGHRAAIASAVDLAKEAGAKRVLPLTVGGPFHSRYMEAAATDFCRTVSHTTFLDAQIPVVLNTTAQAATRADQLREELCGQVSHAVQWEASLRALHDLGCRTFLELGPGQVLTGMVRRTLAGVTTHAAGTPETIEAALQAIAGVEAHRG
jgi:[acyl-carrier-protein] S-malonyltransferase